MSTKSVVIGVIVIIIVAAGLYFVIKSSSSMSPATTTPTATSTQATTTPQVQAQDVTVGTGTTAAPNDVVSVLYVGYIGTISSSTVFDSSAAHGNQPLSFTLGSQQLIPGFQIGVNGMKVGGERLMAIPPELGYGTNPLTDSTGKVIVPANSTIIFDVRLVKVVQGTSTPATTGATTQ